MVNVLLINPWIYDFAAYDFWNKPIGLLSLASLLRMNGIRVFFLDCLNPHYPDLRSPGSSITSKRKTSGHGAYAKERIPKPAPLRYFPRHYHRYGISPDFFLRSLAEIEQPDLIMITSMMTYWYPGVFDTIKLLKRAFPSVPVILGGNYVTLCPEHASYSGADFCLAGPAEQSIPSFLKYFCDRDMDFIPVSNNLDSYPYPAFDLIFHLDQVPILTSRGCPFRCTYCASPLLNKQFLRRDPTRVADEIEYWHIRFGVDHFSFYDDALLMEPRELIIPLLHELIRRNLHLQFHCPNGLHLREITSELSSLMFSAGFKTIRFGFETSDAQQQATTGGKVKNENLIDAVAHLIEAGYSKEDIGVYLLCGLPEQSSDEVLDSIRFVQSCGARPIIAEYSPIPGTTLWHKAVRSSHYPISEEPLFQNNTLLPCQNDSLTYEMYTFLKQTAKTRLSTC
jgi:radical SAM superfamily enzyme YgiQ (UPF0313 family)